ncbi:MAG TPA: DUF4342 domain-containing protein [Bacillota bacterium]|nr:DUF4342 domain-containing protein [Bacillota bacterium]
MENLEKIDIVRDRMHTSYEEAKQALETANWDLIETLVLLERQEANRKEEIFIRGNELVEKVKELVRKGNVSRIIVRQDEKVLIEIPVTAGVVGALLAPQLAIIGAVAALVSRCTVEIEKNDSEVYH